jgi:hypothetical protein
VADARLPPLGFDSSAHSTRSCIMKVSLFALAVAALAGLSLADEVSYYSVYDCSGTPDETMELP